MLAVTTRLVAVRKTLLILTALSGGFNAIFSAALLGFQLIKTSGYQRPVPAILVGAILSAAFPSHFLWTKPFSFGKGSTAARVATFARSIACELIAWGGLGAFTLICVADLHSDTPGLFSSCGGFTMCRLLTAVLALSWLTFLFVSLSFAALLLSTIYFTVRRSTAIATLTTSFDQVDWAVYASRPARGKKGRVPGATSLKRMDEREIVEQRGRPQEVFVVVESHEEEEENRRRREEPPLIGGAF